MGGTNDVIDTSNTENTTMELYYQEQHSNVNTHGDTNHTNHPSTTPTTTTTTPQPPKTITTTTTDYNNSTVNATSATTILLTHASSL